MKELEKLSVRLYNGHDHTARNEIKDRFSDNDSGSSRICLFSANDQEIFQLSLQFESMF